MMALIVIIIIMRTQRRRTLRNGKEEKLMDKYVASVFIIYCIHSLSYCVKP